MTSAPPPPSAAPTPPQDGVQTLPYVGRCCPHCDYELEGLPRGTSLCPECGGSLSARAYAMAAARRMRKSLIARLALWSSPGAAFFGAIAAFLSHQGGYAALLIALLCMWAGGTTAVYYSAKDRSRRNLPKAMLIGAPVGIAYLLAVVVIAVAIVLGIKFLSELR